MKRCAVEAWAEDGPAVDAAELPEPALEAVLAALAEADPGASTVLRISCPCGRQWADELDIRSVLWDDLTDWAGRTLNEVHLLAQALRLVRGGNPGVERAGGGAGTWRRAGC